MTTQSATEDRLLTVREAADKLGTTPGNIYDWIKNDKGPEYVRFGRSIRYRLSVIEEWIERHTHVPARNRR